MVSIRAIRLFWKPAVFALCLAPLAILLLRAFMVGELRLGPNPVEDIQDELGIWGIRFLMLTLAVTPFRHLIGQAWPVQFRRMLGLFAFAYVSLHFLNYLVLDKQFDFGVILEDVTERQFITIGFVALLAMTPLAITSTNGWRRRLRHNWVTLHKLVYGIAAAACWHFFSQVKKDLTEPLIYIAILTVLLVARVVIDGSRSERRTA